MFITKTRDALGMFSGIGDQYGDIGIDTNIPSFNITEIKTKVTSIETSFESLQKPDIDFDLWFLQLSYLSDGFVFADSVFRAYVSVKLLLKYWFATSLAMPKIDLRVNKEIRNPFRMHPIRAAVAFLTSSIGGFIIFVVSSAWLIGIIASLYIPLLSSYTSGCVSNNADGTFVSKNIFSIAYNHAYQDGSGLLIEGMDAFDLKRGDTCNSRYASSASSQNKINSNFAAYSTFHKEIMNNMGLAQRCIDVNELDSAFLDACCGIATYQECAGKRGTNFNVACPIDKRKEMLKIPMPYDQPGT